jgi:hypothetical protein
MARKRTSQAVVTPAQPRLAEESAYYRVSPLRDAFPISAYYTALGPTPTDRLRDEGKAARAFEWTERHVQAAWHDPQLRPDALKTSDGESVEVEDPGIWNLEAGPDFTGAVLRIGHERRRLAGDVEIHIHPADWSRHGHQRDPRYRAVRFHVTYFPGRFESKDFPPGTVHISLRAAIQREHRFALDTVDVTAYPYAARAPHPPCHAVLKQYSPDERRFVLEAAGQERLRRKAERLAIAMEEKGIEQAVYEEVMPALGYKNNKLPFRRLASLLPVTDWPALTGGDPVHAYALLLGISGLMPPEPLPRWDDETRRFVRRLWRHWWRYQERFASRALDARMWRLDGLRPANHPVRRLMAAAALFTSSPSLVERWKSISTGTTRGQEACRLVVHTLTNVRAAYWSRRMSLGSRPTGKPIALIGPERAGAICANITLPFWAAQGARDSFIHEATACLPSEPDNGLVKQTAHYLLGRDHAPSLYRAPVCKQGLLQIFHDFCLPDRTRCAACPLPAMLMDAKKLHAD